MKPPNDQFDCDFEGQHGLCFGWIQKKDDDFDWQINHGPTQSGKSFPTGPLIDHTKKTKLGTYLYTEATYPKEGYRAVLVTPTLELISKNGYCLNFWSV